MNGQKVVYRHSGILYSLKKNEILIHVATWMDLEDIMLSEKSQTRKDKDGMTPLTGGSWRSQIPRDRKRTRGCQGLRGRRNGEVEFTGHGFSWG